MVADNISLLASDDVSRIAKAYAIAPLKPVKFNIFFRLLQGFNRSEMREISLQSDSSSILEKEEIFSDKTIKISV